MFRSDYFIVWAKGAFVILVLGVLLMVCGPVPSSFAGDSLPADKSASFYFYRCGGCHTVGRGKSTGPDLVTASKWSDADLKTAIKKMEKNTGLLSEEDIAAMVGFLKDPKVSERIEVQKQQIEVELRAKLPAPSLEVGRALFRGEKVFSRGGPACISCHRFVHEGGSLGPDLTHVKDKMTGVVLQSAIENSNYKIMRASYAQRKITTEESLHLAEFLSHPERSDNRFAAIPGDVHRWAWCGMALFAVLLWALNRYRKGPTRESLVRKFMGR